MAEGEWENFHPGGQCGLNPEAYWPKRSLFCQQCIQIQRPGEHG